MVLRPKGLAGLCITFMLLASSLVRADESLLYYVLDGSGSMWGRVDNRTKIEIAKETLGGLIDKMPDNLQSGLTVYGHRRKGDCGDIEQLISAGPINKAEAQKTINKISPKGKTPIAAAIRKTLEQFRNREANTTVLLVSDGIETCGEDPCSVTQQLKESGIPFVMHVVGFDVGNKASSQLSCVAKAGGGRYFPAADANELLDALQTVQTSVIEKRVLPAPPPPPTSVEQNITSSSKSIRIKAKGPGSIAFQHQDWLKTPYYWKLVDPETGKAKGRFSGLGKQLVPQGEYQLLWRQDEHGGSEVLLSEIVSVKSRKTTQVPLLTAIRANVPSWVDKPYFWSLHEPGQRQPLARFRKMQAQLVPEGEYDLFWRQVEHGASAVKLARVQLERDKLNDVAFNTAINLAPADWVAKKAYYWGLKDINTNKWVAKFGGNLRPQLVAPGNYRLVYREIEHGTQESDLGEIQILADQMNEVPINTGVKLIPQPGMELPYRVHFVEIDDTGKALQRVEMRKRFGPLILKPGRYRIDYHQKEHSTQMITIVDEFDLPEGALVEIEL